MTVIRSMFVLVIVAMVAGLPGAIAAADPSTVWLCKPGATPDPCEGSQATTDVASGTVQDQTQPGGPPVDCFYVYPTVSFQPGPNASDTAGIEQQVIAQQQAQRFSSHCRVFAPVYRQSTLLGLATSPGDARSDALGTAYGDIERAWDDYMSHYNGGRGVVLIGHSQGSYLLRALIRHHIDAAPAARRSIVSALLLGGNVLVKRGQTVGGDFENIPACTAEDQIGCVIAFSTFNDVPPADSRFGRSPESDTYGERLDLPWGPDYDVLCTNPASLGANDRRPIDSVLRTLVEVPGAHPVVADANALVASTPFVVPAEHYSARCEMDGGAHVLRIDGADAASLRPLPTAQWGLHLSDVNIALGTLTDIVDKQIRTYLTQR
nr:DUF3089 domain-containing protein [Rhodococcus sp. (in: high G+C Gram-positive bacteria)]